MKPELGAQAPPLRTGGWPSAIFARGDPSRSSPGFLADCLGVSVESVRRALGDLPVRGLIAR